jgi:hypothetical protein
VTRAMASRRPGGANAGSTSSPSRQPSVLGVRIWHLADMPRRPIWSPHQSGHAPTHGTLIGDLSGRERRMCMRSFENTAARRGARFHFFDHCRPAGLADASNRSGRGQGAPRNLGGRGRSSITKTERPQSANLLQMTRGLRYKLRQRGRGYEGPDPAGSRGIDPSLQPPPCGGR